MLQQITTIFFDWDHTLAYTKIGDNKFSTRLTAMFQLAGLPYSHKEVAAALAIQKTEVDNGQSPPPGALQTRQEIGLQSRRLLQILGHTDTSWPQLIKLYGTYAQLPTFLYDDTLSILLAVQAQGYKLGILSNHSSSARPVIEEFVGNLIPARHIVISEEEGVHKPARTIFRRAAARTHTPPEQCLLVGDNLTVDAIGAVTNGRFAAGIWLDRLNKGGDVNLPPSVQRITHLEQLSDIMGSV